MYGAYVVKLIWNPSSCYYVFDKFYCNKEYLNGNIDCLFDRTCDNKEYLSGNRNMLDGR